MNYTPYETPRKLCYAMAGEAAFYDPALTARPHNMYEPDRTIWWLVPSTDWPAYPYAKLFFDWETAEHHGLWAGVYVEKGLGSAVGKTYPQTWLMNGDWAWHRLLQRLRDGQLEERIRNLADSISAPVLVKVEALYAGVTGFNPDDEKPFVQRDEYVLAWNADDEQFTVVGTPMKGIRVLGDASRLRAFSDLTSEVETLTENAWVWVDFMIMIGMRIGTPPEPASQEDWRDATLWSRFLQPLHEALV